MGGDAGSHCQMDTKAGVFLSLDCDVHVLLTVSTETGPIERLQSTWIDCKNAVIGVMTS